MSIRRFSKISLNSRFFATVRPLHSQIYSNKPPKRVGTDQHETASGNIVHDSLGKENSISEEDIVNKKSEKGKGLSPMANWLLAVSVTVGIVYLGSWQYAKQNKDFQSTFIQYAPFGSRLFSVEIPLPKATKSFEAKPLASTVVPPPPPSSGKNKTSEATTISNGTKRNPIASNHQEVSDLPPTSLSPAVDKNPIQSVNKTASVEQENSSRAMLHGAALEGGEPMEDQYIIQDRIDFTKQPADVAINKVSAKDVDDHSPSVHANHAEKIDDKGMNSGDKIDSIGSAVSSSNSVPVDLPPMPSQSPQSQRPTASSTSVNVPMSSHEREKLLNAMQAYLKTIQSQISTADQSSDPTLRVLSQFVVTLQEDIASLHSSQSTTTTDHRYPLPWPHLESFLTVSLLHADYLQEQLSSVHHQLKDQQSQVSQYAKEKQTRMQEFQQKLRQLVLKESASREARLVSLQQKQQSLIEQLRDDAAASTEMRFATSSLFAVDRLLSQMKAENLKESDAGKITNSLLLSDLSMLTNRLSLLEDPFLNQIADSIKKRHERGEISTFLQLNKRFDRVEEAVRSAQFAEDENMGFFSLFVSSVLSKISRKYPLNQMIKSSDGDISYDVEMILMDTQKALSSRDLVKAIESMMKLKGWSKILAQDWLEEARKSAELIQGLELCQSRLEQKRLVYV